jgi:hypothetical protein
MKRASWNLHVIYFTKGGMLVNRINKIGIKRKVWYGFPNLSFTV